MVRISRKCVYFGVIASFIVFSLLLSNVPRDSQFFSPEIKSSSNGSFSFSGDYDGDLSIMYFEENWTFSMWNNQNSSTNKIRYNTTYWGQEYNVRSLDIRAGNLNNLSGIANYSVAEDISNQISLLPSYAFAQEFTAPELMQINEIMIYLNLLALRPRYYELFIFDAFLHRELAWAYYHDTRIFVNEWLTLYPSQTVLESGERYNIVLKVWFQPGGYNETFDYWKAENYSSPVYNKGLTRYSPDGFNWARVANDNTVDMLCNFSYSKFIDPREVDLKFIINNEVVIPTLQITPWGFQGYEAFTAFTFDAPLSQDINVTIMTNQTIPTMDIEIVIYYFMLISANGTYSADEDGIEWEITYPYEEISFGWPPPIFLFEKDWDFVQLHDPNDSEMGDIYFGPITLYNSSYYGITIFFGPPLIEGNYTGIFHSPSYCHAINTKVKQGSQFISIPSVETGQTIILEAVISDPFNEPISGGDGQIFFYSPSGELLYNESSLQSINGTMSSSEISFLSVEGTYEAKIFWTDGREAAIYTVTLFVEAPVNILFWVILSVGLALVSTPVALLTLKYLRQRNWQKSLKNLFVLTKDGLSVYEYSFGIEIQDPALISAMISALTNFVREATGSKRSLRTVDQEDKKVILNHGNHTTIALMSEKDLPIIHKRVKKFTEAFEDKFGSKLKGWKGETTMFKETDIIVNKFFPINVEEQIIHGVRGKLIDFRNKLETMTQPREIISLIREITEFLSRYRAIVNKYYVDYYFEIINIAEQKITSH
ncbi:MAG: hypothetical protein ACW986_01620 [Promethearchaeota archaeon]|jgi:hypothetical protein